MESHSPFNVASPVSRWVSDGISGHGLEFLHHNSVLPALQPSSGSGYLIQFNCYRLKPTLWCYISGYSYQKRGTPPLEAGMPQKCGLPRSPGRVQLNPVWRSRPIWSCSAERRADRAQLSNLSSVANSDRPLQQAHDGSSRRGISLTGYDSRRWRPGPRFHPTRIVS